MFQDIALVEQALEDRDNDVSLEVSTGGGGVGGVREVEWGMRWKEVREWDGT